MIGRTILHYKITAKLGEGGMGEVYLADDTKLQRRVALKFLPESLRQDPEARERLLREARAASRLQHSNILTIHAVEESEGLDFIVMEYIEGKPLTESPQNERRTLSDLLDIAIAVADGLQRAHTAGVIHRDIKPANILIDTEGNPRILDFGIAKMQDAGKLTKTGSTAGTAAYMSPEQVQGREVDARSDLFSLGVVLYEMLTGHLPFHGEHQAALVYAIVNETPEPLSRYKADLPPELERIVAKALTKPVNERYQSAADLCADLRALRRHGSDTSTVATAKPSLAVLPFANMSPDAENEFFADGLTEELITAFSKMKNLRVVARTSAFQFKGKTSDIRRVGEELSVGTVLEGSVRRSGNRLRVTAQLINVADGYHIWSERYDREMADVFEIQDNIVRAIVDALKVKLVGGGMATVVETRTSNLEAYQLILQARYFWNKRTSVALAKAESLYKEALALDPDFADAHAGLAMTYVTMNDYTDRDPATLRHLAEPLARDALRLNPDSVEAHCTMGFLQGDCFQWENGGRSLQRAIEVNPGFATAHHWYALLLFGMGQLAKATAELELAKTLDPLSLVIRANLATAHRLSGNLDLAKAELDAALVMDQYFPPLNTHCAYYHEQIGDYNAAFDDVRRTAVSNPHGRISSHGARYLFLAGRYAEAAEALDAWIQRLDNVALTGSFTEAFRNGGVDGIRRRVIELFDTPWDHHFALFDFIASLLVALGEHDRAIRWLDRGCEVSTHQIVTMSYTMQTWTPLFQNPKFLAVLRKAGLTLPANIPPQP